MAVCGPSCCGKTELIFKMLLHGTFSPEFQKIFYFYQHDQPNYQSLGKKLNIEFKQFSGFELVSEIENCLLVFDDSCEELFNDKEFFKLATAGRHRNISVICVKHNLFQQSKCSRTIDLNTTHIILFKSPPDTPQINFIGQQLNNTQFLKESYELAIRKQFGHLLINLDPKTSDVLRYCSNIVPPGPSIFYLPSAKSVITKLTDEREKELCMLRQMLDTSDSNIKKIMKTAPNNFIKFLCECLLNIVNGNVPVNKTKLECYENSFKTLLSDQTSLKQKRKLLAKETELVRIVGFSCYRYLTKE